MISWTDTHAHLYSKEFDDDREAMISRAKAAGIGKIFMPNIDSSSVDAMLEVEKTYKDCIPMMGLHPCSVKEDFESELRVVESWLNKRKFAAIGEMGTDLYWDKTFWEQQKVAFVTQVGWARQYGLPIVIHCRSSIDETIALLAPMVTERLTGIFHCFSGSIDQARQIIDMGFYLGIGGVVTFKNGGLDKVIPEIDPGNLVLETDCPFLAPVPHRGKRNETSYIPLVAEKICALSGLTPEELRTITTANAERIFRSTEAD